MDVSAINELESIKKELNSIIKELESISNGVRNDFVGIGSERCSDSINSVLNQYYRVRRQLNDIDTNTVVANYTKTYEGGGSR